MRLRGARPGTTAAVDPDRRWPAPAHLDHVRQDDPFRARGLQGSRIDVLFKHETEKATLLCGGTQSHGAHSPPGRRSLATLLSGERGRCGLKGCPAHSSSS
jgi:hypothetical protein